MAVLGIKLIAICFLLCLGGTVTSAAHADEDPISEKRRFLLQRHDTISCNFEHSSICGYTQDTHEAFDWTRRTGHTQSASTGPTNDHTHGNPSGHYMYIETSSPRKPGDVARLTSLPYPTLLTPLCMQFWYHMYGSSVGTLKVYTKHGSSSPHLLYSRHGDQGNVWHGVTVQLQVSRAPSTIQVVFEGVRGASYHGDIAIDDVRLHTAICPTVDGHWGSWQDWLPCSVPCGTGSKRRVRQCNNPEPAHGGHSCPGSATQTSTCYSHSCTVNGHWGSWSSWSSCSATCGAATRTSHRSCNNPAPTHGGHTCSGSGSKHETCVNHRCSTAPVNGNWGHWSGYSACSITCSALTGTQTKTRRCNSPAPSGGGHACPGSSTYLHTCHGTSTTCRLNGGWSGWHTWSRCTTSCDLGHMTRQRSCSSPAPSHGGTSCSGDSTESHDCSLGACPEWGHWFDGACSMTCGNGTRERLRHCSTGKDTDCSGHAYLQVPCFGDGCT